MHGPTWSPETVLSLAVLGEASGEDEAILQVDGAGTLATLVRNSLFLYFTSSRYIDSMIIRQIARKIKK